MIIPLLILSILSYIAYYPTPEKEHLTNFEVAKILELDNDTIKNYVIGLRTGVSCKKYIFKNFYMHYSDLLRLNPRLVNVQLVLNMSANDFLQKCIIAHSYPFISLP